MRGHQVTGSGCRTNVTTQTRSLVVGPEFCDATSRSSDIDWSKVKSVAAIARPAGSPNALVRVCMRDRTDLAFQAGSDDNAFRLNQTMQTLQFACNSGTAPARIPAAPDPGKLPAASAAPPIGSAVEALSVSRGSAQAGQPFRTWRDRTGRYRCNKQDGTVGLVVGTGTDAPVSRKRGTRAGICSLGSRCERARHTRYRHTRRVGRKRLLRSRAAETSETRIPTGKISLNVIGRRNRGLA